MKTYRWAAATDITLQKSLHQRDCLATTVDRGGTSAHRRFLLFCVKFSACADFGSLQQVGRQQWRETLELPSTKMTAKILSYSVIKNILVCLDRVPTLSLYREHRLSFFNHSSYTASLLSTNRFQPFLPQKCRLMICLQNESGSSRPRQRDIFAETLADSPSEETPSQWTMECPWILRTSVLK